MQTPSFITMISRVEEPLPLHPPNRPAHTPAHTTPPPNLSPPLPPPLAPVLSHLGSACPCQIRGTRGGGGVSYGDTSPPTGQQRYEDFQGGELLVTVFISFFYEHVQ